MFMDAWTTAGFIIFVFVTVVWLLSLAIHDSGIVDVFWGLGFMAVVWFSPAFDAGSLAPRAWLAALLVTTWGIRLSAHLLWRDWGRGEDYRYRVWRDRAGGAWWWRSYVKVFLVQGVVMWVVAAPVVAVLSGAAQPTLGWIDLLAVAVWAVGFGIETLGDLQLARFKANPENQGRPMTGGVWRYTRHPNYFGDSSVWWGLYLVAVASGAWWSIFSPVLMTYMLLRVSGVSAFERALQDSRPGYREYVESTSAFFPKPPRRPH